MARRKSSNLRIYNLAKVGVNVDTDNLHVPVGAYRQAQNIHRNPVSSQAESIVSRDGLRNLNALALGSGAVLGGVTIPAFESGTGDASLFLGFGD
jgi:hypothetical protein